MTDLLDALDRQTTLLVADIRALDDLSAPSLCPGWSRDHVLNHIARNAEALSRLVGAAVDGTGETMYSSPEGRDADIDAGVGRPAAVVVDEVAATAVPLAEDLRRLGPEHRDIELERTPGGPTFKGGMLPFMRLREVVYHHVDLDTGFGFDDLDGELQTLFIENEIKRQQGGPSPLSATIRSTEGDTWTLGDGATEVTGTRGAILRWLARQDPSGVTSSGDLPSLTAGL
ncbi:maleylpyruvate isomerase family mycothiol-dependent enzyme [Knoellia subterranea]|uniref:maleylpyruvate isomerase family mycothiol-dependent enzyme n=1 Tax=Knoellia subterranea TaxID=184882 RepID=UPI001470748A|nr:maleylpyruvate isomerase family mycothiol-dependent enzyme [Knoellia subterranea]